ncbi:5-oxoprolinase [Mrakia frigida]|uniref:5-oxoprolinase n=1 Tax=Mrakia frigida TaxID=29902 RepID=UPI003FCC02F5
MSSSSPPTQPPLPELPDASIRVAIDRGGTFTDVWASYPDLTVTSEAADGRKEIVVKLLSVDPSNYGDAPVEGIRRVLEIATGRRHPRGKKLDVSKIEYTRLSTTVATNCLLERTGEKVALLITEGFEDLLLIGNQSRPKIFDLNISRPSQLYDTVLSIDERVTLVGFTTDPKAEENAIVWNEAGDAVERGYKGQAEVGKGGKVVRGLSGESVRILKEPDLEAIRPKLVALFEAGYRSLSVIFIHSYTFPDHELLVGKLAESIGFEHISLSSQLLPMIKAVPRGVSATADAYLTPVLQKYLDGFFSGFELPNNDKNAMRVEFMGSDGGLVNLNGFSGLKSLLSGPAGGVVGFALTAYSPTSSDPPPVIGLDIGGTSTDVSRYAGRFETVYETTTAGITINSAQLDINTVAAGGGSCLTFRNGLFLAGPASAGAHPGPACYRKGGPLALTDANLFLGRLVPSFFPKVFGASENEGLDPSASERSFEVLARQIKNETGWEGDLDEMVYGFVRVANESMARPIRNLTEARGFDLGKHILASFGGAGGQHACEIAQSLGIRRIIIHRYSSILSAYGLALSDRVFETQEPSAEIWNLEKRAGLVQRLSKLDAICQAGLEEQGFEPSGIKVQRFLNMRYTGTDTSIMTIQPNDSEDFGAAFEAEYLLEFGFKLNATIIVDDVRCRGVGTSYSSLPPSPLLEMESLNFKDVDPSKKKETASVYFDQVGRVKDTPVFLLGDLDVGDKIVGPALLIDGTQTILLVPEAVAHSTTTSLVIDLPKKEIVEEVQFA